MSPEQVLREEIDQRSDIYSLGVIAFEILSGRPPFNGDSPMAVAFKQVYDPLPRLQTIQGKAHLSLESVVLRALAKDARERYPTATAFAQAFRSALKQDQKLTRRNARSKRAVETEKAGSETGASPMPPQPPAPPPLNAIPYLPPLPEISPRSISPRRPAPWTGWKVQHILAMLLATWLGLLLALAVAAAAWRRGTASKPDFEIVYDDTGVAVMNTSGGPQDLTNLTFRRVSDSGAVTASFPALQWVRSGLGPVNALQAGACFQLLLPDPGSLPLIPGKAPAKPDACQVSQGWLLAQDPDWRFWLVQDQSQAFQVLSGQRVIQTCQISEGSCQFSLPKTE
jgi:hypothetical protein